MFCVGIKYQIRSSYTLNTVLLSFLNRSIDSLFDNMNASSGDILEFDCCFNA
jgi:hypothetical protein